MTPDKDEGVNSTAFSDKLSNGNSDQTIDTKVHVIQRTSSFSSFVTVDSPAQEEAKLEGAGKEVRRWRNDRIRGHKMVSSTRITRSKLHVLGEN